MTPMKEDLICCLVLFMGMIAGWMWNDILGGNRFYDYLCGRAPRK